MPQVKDPVTVQRYHFASPLAAGFSRTMSVVGTPMCGSTKLSGLPHACGILWALTPRFQPERSMLGFEVRPRDLNSSQKFWTRARDSHLSVGRVGGDLHRDVLGLQPHEGPRDGVCSAQSPLPSPSPPASCPRPAPATRYGVFCWYRHDSQCTKMMFKVQESAQSAACGCKHCLQCTLDLVAMPFRP